MDTAVSQSFQFSTWKDLRKIVPKRTSSVLLSQRFAEKQRLRVSLSNSNRTIYVVSDVSCSYRNNPAAVLESGSSHVPLDESLILKKKSQEIVPYLNGRCIYLVGMMGSGKTTVGKVLSQVLHYSFSDCDTVVEEEVGTSVADMFKLYGERFFRDKETDALRKLSSMDHLVVSTGGGAVIRPINWKYMQKGISIWLDVPLEALAQRIAAVGTNSRPLLHHDSGDAYSKALIRLSNLLEERGEAYANAKAKVSLEKIAAKQGVRDVLKLSPTVIALEALEQIEGFVKPENDYYLSELPRPSNNM